MVGGFYQLGGFHPQIHWFRYDDKRLAQTIAGQGSPLRVGNDPLELILGIKRSGTSHLLLTESQAWDVSSRLRLPSPSGSPIPSTSFESLSPIDFWDAEELAKKLATLKPKHHKGRSQVDNSQVNKSFNEGGDQGIYRAAFEHGRLLYQIMHGRTELKNFGLNDASWTNSFRICSFVFNVFGVDDRYRAQRIANPKVLDVGVSSGCVPDLDEMEGTTHFSVDNNRCMEGRRTKFEHGETEVLSEVLIGERLRTFFGAGSDRHPTVLLVHGEEISRNALRDFGVDVSAWRSGLQHLLGFNVAQVKSEAGPSRPNDPRRRPSAYSQPESKREPELKREFEPKLEWQSPPSSSRANYDHRQHRPRSRSRSPRRPYPFLDERNSRAPSSRYDYPSRRSPPSSRDSYGSVKPDQHDYAGPRKPDAYAPVYVVDVQQLYQKVMQTEVGADCVAAMSRQLKITKDQGFCAGNEAVTIIEIWRSMISGSSVDDQRTFRGPLVTESGPAKAKVSVDPPGDSDEERDPNDIVQNPTSMFPDDPDSDDYGSSDEY